MVIASYQILNIFYNTYLFTKMFLLTSNSIKIVLKMFFHIFCNLNIYSGKKFILMSYIRRKLRSINTKN